MSMYFTENLWQTIFVVIFPVTRFPLSKIQNQMKMKHASHFSSFSPDKTPATPNVYLSFSMSARPSVLFFSKYFTPFQIFPQFPFCQLEQNGKWGEKSPYQLVFLPCNSYIGLLGNSTNIAQLQWTRTGWILIVDFVKKNISLTPLKPAPSPVLWNQFPHCCSDWVCWCGGSRDNAAIPLEIMPRRTSCLFR